MPVKQCSKCKEWKDTADFRKKSASKDGLTYRCKTCLKASEHQGYIENRDQYAIRQAEYYKANRDRVIERSKLWQKQNPDKAREKSRNWNREHREHRAKYDQKWLQDNLDRHIAKEHRRRAQKRGNGGTYTVDEWNMLLAHYNNTCLCCGIKGEDTKLGKLTIDHVTPLIKGGSNNIENIQPLCHSCNSSKRDRVTDYRLSDILKELIEVINQLPESEQREVLKYARYRLINR